MTEAAGAGPARSSKVSAGRGPTSTGVGRLPDRYTPGVVLELTLVGAPVHAGVAGRLDKPPVDGRVSLGLLTPLRGQHLAGGRDIAPPVGLHSSVHFGFRAEPLRRARRYGLAALELVLTARCAPRDQHQGGDACRYAHDHVHVTQHDGCWFTP